MYELALPRVLNAYGISYQRIFDFQKGYRNEIWPVLTDSDQMLNVTFYKREPGIRQRIAQADKVSEYLAQNGMPTRQRFDKRTLTLKSGAFVTNIGVYNYLPGHTIPWESYTMDKIKMLGATMSNMHSLLSVMTETSLPSVYDEYVVIIGRMYEYFSTPKVNDAILRKLNIHIKADKFDTYIKLLELCKSKSGQQPIHCIKLLINININ